MSLFRKSLWAALTLSATAFVGCQNETTTPATPDQMPVPAVKTDPKAETKVEVNTSTLPIPGPDVKVDVKAEGEKPPEGLKLEGPKGIETPAPAPLPTPEKKDEKAASVKLEPEEISEIEKLPADQQKLALKQLICPVSDEHLGAMGPPIKVEAEGKTFFLCCKGCQKDLAKDAKAVVAKLKN